MHLKTFLTLGLASLSTAAQMDVPAVRGTLGALNNGFTILDRSLKNVTLATVNATINGINAGLKDLGKTLTETSVALSSSRPLTPFDFLGLSASFQIVSRTLKTLATDLAANRLLIVKAGQADRLMEGLRAVKPGIIALNNGIQHQISFVVPIKPVDADVIMDSSLVALLSIFKGESGTISLPAGVWPLAGGPKPPARRSVRRSMVQFVA
jgi:hypothetical protein